MSRPTTADDEDAVSRDDRSAGGDDPAGPGSDVLIDVCVSDDVVDDRGQLRAAAIFDWIDATSSLVASRYGRLPGVAITVDGCELREVVQLGDRIVMRGRVVYTSRHSLGVVVTMDATGRADGVTRDALTAYLTFVYLDADGAPAPVPPFSPQDEPQALLHREGDLRRQFHRELSRDRSVLSRPELLLVGAAPDNRRDAPVYYLLRELGSRMATRRRRTGAGVRSPESSRIHRIEPVRGRAVDADGTVHGSRILRWMETCAAMSAAAFVDAPVRLVGVHGVAFAQPVPPNVFVHLTAVAVHSDDDGVTAHVTVSAENPLTGDTLDAVRGFLTYAPIDPDVAVPAVARPGPTQAALFLEVSLRKALRDRIAAGGRTRRAATRPITSA
jgi:acyl-CoA hydrolase